MMRRLASLVSVVSALALGGQAHASEIDWGAGAEVLAREEMDDLRGGFMVTPGVEVNFGAQVTTYVNGAPALSTQLTWTDVGAVVERSVGALGQRIDGLSPAERNALGLGGLEGVGGVVISDADGVTALVHNITDGALQNIILNNASGRDLRQEIDVTLTLPGFASVQEAINLERLGIRLSADMGEVQFGR